MENKSVLVSNNEGIVTLTINRPKALNAINGDVMTGLNNWFSEGFKEIKKLKGVIITGAGEKAFVAGADIKGFLGKTSDEAMSLSKYGQETYFLIENFHVPVIAAVNGFALGGGCELAMACHMRLASTSAKFGQPEVNLGLLPGYGGSQRLPQLIGKGRALELLLTGNMIDAQTAHSFGLVNHVTSSEDLLVTAEKFIGKIATKGPQAVSITIKAVNDSYSNVDGYETEHRAFGTLMTGDECKEGVAAFIEKRKPNFNRP